MFLFLQIILGILVILLIILQSRGAGIGSAWGGGGELYGTRRGMEKTLFKATVIIVIFFILVSIVLFLS